MMIFDQYSNTSITFQVHDQLFLYYDKLPFHRKKLSY